MDIAAARPEPIPFFGEMSSTNPVFILPGALRERSESIATGLHPLSRPAQGSSVQSRDWSSCRKVRRRLRSPVSAYTHFANSYVVKPVDYDQCVTAASQLGLYWRVLNVPPPRKET